MSRSEFFPRCSYHYSLQSALSFWRLILVVTLFGCTLHTKLRADWSWQSDQATAKFTNAQPVAEFTFENKGNKPLTVTDLKFSCSCAEYSFTSGTANAGKEGVLRILLCPTKKPTLELVAFGSGEATATPLTIYIPQRMPGECRSRPAQSERGRGAVPGGN